MFISYKKTSNYGRYVLPLVILYDCVLFFPPGVPFVPALSLLFNFKMADFYVISNRKSELILGQAELIESMAEWKSIKRLYNIVLRISL